MFSNNWFIFLLIVMLSFFTDGEISRREAIVMLAILFALSITNSSDDDIDDDDDDDDDTVRNCFCNHTIWFAPIVTPYTPQNDILRGPCAVRTFECLCDDSAKLTRENTRSVLWAQTHKVQKAGNEFLLFENETTTAQTIIYAPQNRDVLRGPQCYQLK